MNKKIRIAGIIAALIVSIVILTSPSSPPPIPEPPKDNMKNQFILIHMSDDHFFIENQKNGKVIEFKGKNAREDAYAIINRLTRKETK